MSFSVKIIADSISPGGARITTFALKYPRFIHSELMTHRIFSRSAASSRAIPFKRLVKNTWKDIAYPIEFRANQKGMQAGAPLPAWRERACRGIWTLHSWVSGVMAWLLTVIGAHKQYANRLIEPTGHISVVVTSTNYTNFFALRYHSAAQPEICELARLMYEAYTNSIPNLLTPGKWHLPFVTPQDRAAISISSDNIEEWLPLIKQSVSRCARVSYLNHMGKTPTREEDEALYEKLIGSVPGHFSPTEHQAMCLPDPKERSGNFVGWKQYRKMLDGEFIDTFNGPIG